MIPGPRPAHAVHAADEARQLEHVRDDLTREFAALPPTVVDAQVAKVVERLERAPVRSFVPALVRRGAREELKHLV